MGAPELPDPESWGWRSRLDRFKAAVRQGNSLVELVLGFQLLHQGRFRFQETIELGHDIWMLA